MDKLTIHSSPCTDFALAHTPICVTVYINDRRMPELLNVQEFFKSIQTSGCYPLFRCMCEEFGCGGYFMDVLCTPEAWVLKNRYGKRAIRQATSFMYVPQKEKLWEEVEYSIPWSQVKVAAQELVRCFQEELTALLMQYEPVDDALQNHVDCLGEYLRNPLLQ